MLGFINWVKTAIFQRAAPTDKTFSDGDTRIHWESQSQAMSTFQFEETTVEEPTVFDQLPGSPSSPPGQSRM